jgi:hypothetical protein
VFQIEHDFAAHGQLVYCEANLSLFKTPSRFFPSYYNILTIIAQMNRINLQGGMMMNTNNEDQSFDNDAIEKWLENYFLDPLTSYYDQTQFRIDLYETDREWIVEALLPEFRSSDITVYVEDKKLFISLLLVLELTLIKEILVNKILTSIVRKNITHILVLLKENLMKVVPRILLVQSMFIKEQRLGEEKETLLCLSIH